VYEQRETRLKETDPISPQNLYAVTKVQAEEACRFYALNYNVPALSVRLFPPYGPGDHERRLIPYVISSLLAGQSPNLTTGLQKWDFVYVDDIAEAFLAVLAHYPYSQPYEVVNIGTGDPVSVRDMVLTTMRLTGKEIPLSWGAVPHRKNEVWYNSADITKAERLLGWKPLTKPEEGLKRIIDQITGPGH
jgi:nucleoside-diphosphate-sugar epimerase